MLRLNGPPYTIRIKDMETWRRRVLVISRRLGVTHADGVYVGRVEHGRWIADCPCGAGVATHPEWTHAGCLECGRWWPRTVPVRWREIEEVLIVRTRAVNRNWRTESVEQLEAENVSRGLPPREERPRLEVR